MGTKSQFHVLKATYRIAYCCCVLFAICFTIFGVGIVQGQDGELTKKEKQFLKLVRSDIESAKKAVERGRALQAKKEFESAIERISKQGEFSEQLTKEISLDLENLAEIKAKLTEAGVEVASIPAVAGAEATGVSFSKQVAGLLVSKCGNCHVRNSRGQFGMQTFEALMASGMVEAGDPVSSRLIQVIDSGEMPKGGGKVSEEELNLLREWVSGGAKNDGANDVALNQLSNSSGEASVASNADMVEVAKPSGNESVSFAKDIAPILVQECSGCHLDAQRVRGGLNMSNFNVLLRGGDNGVMLNPNAAGESLLVKKLKGTGGGNRMPGGRPALAADVIAKFETWIAEGAKFDGADPAQPTSRLASVASAAGMNHEALAKNRAALAEKNWSRTLPNVAANVTSNNEIQLLTTVSAETSKHWFETTNKLVLQIKKELKLANSLPLVKGKITVYFFEKRYDFNEFGMMVQGHGAPKDQRMNWGFDQVDSFAAILLNSDDSLAEASQIDLCRGLTANTIAAQSSEVPRWFADGIGYQTASEMFAKNEITAQWLPKATEILGRDKDILKQFLAGKLAEDQAGLIGYFVVNNLRSQPGYKKLMSALQQGTGFDEAFQNAFGRTYQEFIAPQKK